MNVAGDRSQSGNCRRSEKHELPRLLRILGDPTETWSILRVADFGEHVCDTLSSDAAALASPTEYTHDSQDRLTVWWSLLSPEDDATMPRILYAGFAVLLWSLRLRAHSNPRRRRNSARFISRLRVRQKPSRFSTALLRCFTPSSLRRRFKVQCDASTRFHLRHRLLGVGAECVGKSIRPGMKTDKQLATGLDAVQRAKATGKRHDERKNTLARWRCSTICGQIDQARA